MSKDLRDTVLSGIIENDIPDLTAKVKVILEINKEDGLWQIALSVGY